MDTQEELQALLRDDPLTKLPAAARAGARKPAANAATDPPLGRWSFDDCNAERTQLFDSSPFDNTAYRSVGVACADGKLRQGVAIAAREDIVYVPDQPDFTFEGGVTVAAWFQPFAVGGTRTLLRKRDTDTSSFALLLNEGRFQFVVSLGEGRAISVASPARARAGVFQHVAGTYDGATLRLYIDGVEVSQFAMTGAIPPGPGPLLMGNDGSERRFNGVLDQAVFATHALDPDEILGLTCTPVSPIVRVTPEEILDAPIGVPMAIDIELVNNNPARCLPSIFSLELFTNEGLDVDPPPFTVFESDPVPSGTTGHITVTATVSEDSEPGDIHFIEFLITEPNSGFQDFPLVFILVGEQTGCFVSTARELMIRNVSVVDDPIRTAFDPGSDDPRNGVWTFKHLVENMAPTPEEAPAMVEAVMNSLTTAQTINGFTVAARPGVRPFLDGNWPRTPDGALDLARAPLRLQAIVNRFDLRDLAGGDAGEGRFVFAFEEDGFPLEATLILEYKLPAASEADVLAWAQAFHALGALPFGEEYNAALQAVTEGFVGRSVHPGQPNGSAINAVRTNEIAFGGIWELREFRLSPASGRLEPVPVELTPDFDFNFSQALADYINQNEADIIAERHDVPAVFAGRPFQGGSVFNDLGTWFAAGVAGEARHHFALNTCNGCHSSSETDTSFLQIVPRFEGEEASLSPFLTGTSVFDPETGQERTFNDLGRRNTDLRAIVCAEPSARSASWARSLRKGIDRVH